MHHPRARFTSCVEQEAFTPGDDQSREAVSFNVDMRPKIGRKVYFFAVVSEPAFDRSIS